MAQALWLLLAKFKVRLRSKLEQRERVRKFAAQLENEVHGKFHLRRV